MNHRDLVASSWYLPSAEDDESCEALEPEEDGPVEIDGLCLECAGFDLIAALEALRSASDNYIFWLEPFDHAIEHTECHLCRCVRQTVGQQDADLDVRIRVKPLEQSALSVDAFRRDELIGGGYLSCGPFDMNMPLDAYKIVYESAVRPWLPSVSSLQPSLEWYNTYTASQAQQQCIDWLSRCNAHDHAEQDHSKCNSRAGEGNTNQGYLVDVHDMCIVEAIKTGNEPYFALSYVCGGAKTLDLSEGNLAALSTKGSLLRSELPRTYTDAMRFTASLGARYLWIDTLCILHDADGGPDQDQIEAMDRIYGYATLVLMASVGTSPKFGLFPRSIEPQMVHGIFLHIDRRTQMDNDGSDHGNTDIFKTKYSTRMWCFQEQHLSRRRVTFGSHWLVFNCCEAEWIVRDDGTGRLIPSPSMGSSLESDAMRLLRDEDHATNEAFHNGRRFDAYAALAQSYTRSELSYAADVERAFAGLASVISHNQTQTVAHNIPMAMLPHALLWASDLRFMYRARSQSNEFPTWSWAWTTDAIFYPVIASLMVSSQQSPSTHLHKSLVATFWLQTGPETRKIEVTSLLHQKVNPTDSEPAEKSCGTDTMALNRHDDSPSTLRFRAYAVSTTGFYTKILPPPDPKPEDWDEVTATQNLFRHNDTSVRKRPVGKIWGLAEGHDCFATPESSGPQDGYFLLALLAIDRKQPRPRDPLKVYFCLAIHLENGISRRIGMVELSEEVFSDAGPERKSWELV